jgi:hypothetical protein
MEKAENASRDPGKQGEDILFRKKGKSAKTVQWEHKV